MSWQVYLENQVLNSGFRAIALEYGWKGPAIDYHKQHLNSPLGKWIVCRDGKLYGYVAEQKQTEVIQPSQALENILGRKDEAIKMIFTIDNNQVVITKNGIVIGCIYVPECEVRQIIETFHSIHNAKIMNWKGPLCTTMNFTINNRPVKVNKMGISIGNTFVPVVKIQQIILAFQKLSQ